VADPHNYHENPYPPAGPSIPLTDHLTVVEHWRDRVDKWREKFYTERDRRYAEVAVEREKALSIKETADTRALELASQIQTYKDEKANELRSQIESERGSYATKDEVNLMQRASSKTSGFVAGIIATVGMVSAVISGFIVYVLSH
jgi:hypothetical protein